MRDKICGRRRKFCTPRQREAQPPPRTHTHTSALSSLCEIAFNGDVFRFSLLCLPAQINELSHVQIPIMLMPDDFKAYSKIKVDNHLFNK